MRSSAARLIVFGAAGSMRRLAGIAAGVALGTGMVLILLGTYLHMPERDDRGGWSTPTGNYREFSTTGDLVAIPRPTITCCRSNARSICAGVRSRKSWWRPRPTTHVAFPAGLPRLATGQYYASPALARLVAKYPHNELGDRLGTMKGVLPSAGAQGTRPSDRLGGRGVGATLGGPERSRSARIPRQGPTCDLAALSRHPRRGLRGLPRAHRAADRHRVPIGSRGTPRTLRDGEAHRRGTQGDGYALGARDGSGFARWVVWRAWASPSRCDRPRRSCRSTARNRTRRISRRLCGWIGRFRPGHDRARGGNGLVAGVPRRTRRTGGDARTRREAQPRGGARSCWWSGLPSSRPRRCSRPRPTEAGQSSSWACGRFRRGRIRHRARGLVAHQSGESGLRSRREVGAVSGGRGSPVPSPTRDLQVGGRSGRGGLHRERVGGHGQFRQPHRYRHQRARTATTQCGRGDARQVVGSRGRWRRPQVRRTAWSERSSPTTTATRDLPS